MTGNVFNIQRFSLNDGPGIRTVVFLKGCPLRCGWCANPESQSALPSLYRDAEKCTKCGLCMRACPTGAAEKGGGETCRACLRCVQACPNGALGIYGARREVGDIVDECMRDEAFYLESGGGVTISGGEPLFQPDFCAALIAALKARGVDTALETTGMAAQNVFESVALTADRLLFDMKHWDDARHKEGTGVGNGLILENLRRAVDAGRDVIVRIPVIPGFNSDISDARMLAKRIVEAGARRVQLLPFHQFGEGKYAQLGMKYAYDGALPLHGEDLGDYTRMFIEAGIEVKI